MGRIAASRTEPRPDELTPERAEELGKCFKSYIYFIDNYVKIYDSVSSDWIPFSLWPAQKYVLREMHKEQLIVILKARQLGISWLSLSYALWNVVFRPIAAVSLFSRRDTESMYMLGQDRLRGMFNNLPPWMRKGHDTVVGSGHEWILSTGSAVRAFPTSAGDGYVSTLAIVDEADLSPDLNKLMRSVKPTIDNGGKLILLSRVNKSEPESEFKTIYRGAKQGENGWKHIFLPWSAHPGRDESWYGRQRRDILSRTGSLDDLYEQYPETDTQALSARTLDKRIPPVWLEMSYQEKKPVYVKGSPSLSALDIYIAPQPGARYVIGADPAEGNPNSDDSALTVVEVMTGEECASFAGKYEPAIFASYISMISTFYNYAPAMVERNNHGHSVIQWMEEHARRTRLLLGHDAESHKTDKKARTKRKRMKAGWLSSTLGKTILYTICADFFRDSARLGEEGASEPVKVLHNLTTFNQLASIEAASLSAPQGQHDDRADSYALAQAGRVQISKLGHSAGMIIETTKGW
jgi:hypothetical protein